MIDKFLKNLYSSLAWRLDYGRNLNGNPIVPKSALVVMTTTRCNFHCPHCLREYNDKDKTLVKDLSPDVFEATLKEAKKINFDFVCFSGGEPILNPDFPKLLELVKKYDYRFNFVSNGWLYEEYWPLIKDMRRNFHGVIMSIDGATAEIHDFVRNKPGSFAKILEAIKFYRQHQIPIVASFCIMRQNRHQLEEFCDFCLKHDIDDIRWAAVLGFKKDAAAYCLMGEDKVKVFKEIGQLITKFANKPSMAATANLTSYGSLSDEKDMAVFCPVLQSVAPSFLDHDGALLPCCDLYENFSKKPLIQKLGFKKCLGINYDTISEIKKQHAGILLDKNIRGALDVCGLCNQSIKDYLNRLDNLQE